MKLKNPIYAEVKEETKTFLNVFKAKNNCKNLGEAIDKIMEDLEILEEIKLFMEECNLLVPTRIELEMINGNLLVFDYPEKLVSYEGLMKILEKEKYGVE